MGLHWGKIPSVWSKTLSIGSKFPVFEVKFPVPAVKFLGSVVKFLGSVVKFLGSVVKCLGFRVKFLWFRSQISRVGSKVWRSERLKLLKRVKRAFTFDLINSLIINENKLFSVPNDCICNKGFEGELCDKCSRYPGCVNGYCNSPWQCICNPVNQKLCYRD